MANDPKTTKPYPHYYRSAAGSLVTVPRWGVWKVDWDWFEEGACPGAHVSFDDDRSEPAISWDCDCCDGGRVPVLMCEAMP
jgi:hypothetical protein